MWRQDTTKAALPGTKLSGHAVRGSHYLTVISDLTPVPDGTGPSRQLEMIPGRSKATCKAPLDAQSKDFGDGIELAVIPIEPY